MPFDGRRVLSLESRRAREMAELIRRQGGAGTVAPSMREAPLERNEEVFAVAERLFDGEFDLMIFMTGVGARALDKLLAGRYPPERFRDALRNLTVVARGPKPVAALRELGAPADLRAPEPNTWREVMGVLQDRPERDVAVQEYGRSNPELTSALERWGARVTPIRIYRWELPEDTGPLREAARELAQGRYAVALFTTPNQIVHLFRIADEEGVTTEMREALRRTVIASIGPSTSEMLASWDLTADFEPSRPKMGFLVKEAAERAAELLARKRSLPKSARQDSTPRRNATR